MLFGLCATSSGAPFHLTHGVRPAAPPRTAPSWRPGHNALSFSLERDTRPMYTRFMRESPCRSASCRGCK